MLDPADRLEAAERIAKGLSISCKRAMLSADERGEYSSATFEKLLRAHLVDRSFNFTPLGLAVRSILRGVPG